MKNKHVPWASFLVCYLAYTSIYVSRVNLSMANSALIEGGFLAASQIGALGTVFSVVYAGGRLFNSALADRIMPWILIVSGLAAAGLSNVLAGFLPVFLLMALLWGVNAYGQSMLWSSILRIIAATYDGPTAKRRTAVMVSTVGTGNLAAILLNTWLIEAFGLRYAFFVPGIINLLLAPAVYFTNRFVPFQGKPKGEPVWRSFRLLLHPEVRPMLVPALCHGVLKDNISLWMAVYFVSFFGIDLKQSAYFVLLIPSVGLVGRLLYNLVYRLMKERENLVSLAGFGVCVLASAILLFKKVHPLTAAICLSLIYAAISLINTSFLSVGPLKFTKTGDTGAVSGIMDLLTYLGAGIGSAVYGVIIEAMGNDGYIVMFASWVALSLLSAFLMARLCRKEKRTETER